MKKLTEETSLYNNLEKMSIDDLLYHDCGLATEYWRETKLDFLS